MMSNCFNCGCKIDITTASNLCFRCEAREKTVPLSYAEEYVVALRKELADLRERCDELSQKLLDAGELHLADETTIRQLERRVKEAERERETTERYWQKEIKARCEVQAALKATRAELVAEQSFHEKTKLRLQAIEEQLGESREYGRATRAALALARARELLREGLQDWDDSLNAETYNDRVCAFLASAAVRTDAPAVPPDSARHLPECDGCVLSGSEDCAKVDCDPVARQQAVERVIATGIALKTVYDNNSPGLGGIAFREHMDALAALDGAGEPPACSPADRIIAHTLTREDLPATVREAAEPTCTWTEDADGIWHTACGSMFEWTAGNCGQNKAAYCMYCGKPLTEVLVAAAEPDTQ